MRSEATALAELLTGSGLVFAPQRGMVRLKGPDALPFIERMSTNKVITLDIDHPIATVFVDNKGHIIDHCLLFLIEKNHIILVSSHDNASNLLSWLLQFHFVEDFIAEETNDFACSFVIAPGGCETLKKPFLKYWQMLSPNSVPVDFFAVLDHHFPDKKIINENVFQNVRINALMPLYPSEINQRWMPQNVGLKQFVADNKGCYIGQEVISKALTYQKNVKSLCGLRLSSEEFNSLKKGALVKDHNGRTGEITAVAPYYWPGEINALLIEGVKIVDDAFLKCAGTFETKNI